MGREDRFDLPSICAWFLPYRLVLGRPESLIFLALVCQCVSCWAKATLLREAYCDDGQGDLDYSRQWFVSNRRGDSGNGNALHGQVSSSDDWRATMEVRP